RHQSLGRRIAAGCSVHTGTDRCITAEVISIPLFSSIGPVEGGREPLVRRQEDTPLECFTPVVVLNVVPTIDESEGHGRPCINRIGEPYAGWCEGLAQTEHEGTRNIVVVPSIDLF